MVKKSEDLWSRPASPDPVLDKLDLSKPWPPMSPEQKAEFVRRHNERVEELLRPFQPRKTRRCPHCKKAI